MGWGGKAGLMCRELHSSPSSPGGYGEDSREISAHSWMTMILAKGCTVEALDWDGGDLHTILQAQLQTH